MLLSPRNMFQEIVNTMSFRIIYIIIISLFLVGCETFEYSPYEIDRDGPTDINANNIARFINSESDTSIIAVIGDTQRFYDATDDIIDKINTINEVDFVIHTGDLVDFGLQREYNWMYELLEKLHAPYVAVVGNHDLIGNGGEIYQNMYGPLNFSFIFNDTKYVYINTNSREFGFEPNVPDISWLEQELSDTTGFSQAIIVQHVPPINQDFNDELVDDFIEVLGSHDNLLLGINGHNHNYNFTASEDGISYLNSASTTTEQFILLKVWNGGFEFELR
ncbi:MAG: Icc protein [Flavobacteriales bacterium]|jgi:Icc protein